MPDQLKSSHFFFNDSLATRVRMYIVRCLEMIRFNFPQPSSITKYIYIAAHIPEMTIKSGNRTLKKNSSNWVVRRNPSMCCCGAHIYEVAPYTNATYKKPPQACLVQYSSVKPIVNNQRSVKRCHIVTLSYAVL